MTPSEERRIRISALQFALELIERRGGEVDYGDGTLYRKHVDPGNPLVRIATELHDEIITLKAQEKREAA